MNDTSLPPSAAETIGRYEVLEEIGRGAMGVVLLAHDPVLERKVALKFLRPELKLDLDARQLLMKRMNQEARAIARITHPGIVALYDIGTDTVKGTYLVFEHAKGPTLEAVLERGRLTPEGTARLARELGEALEAAHSSGILHRDIKPSNIILTEEGSRIADFGVARLPDSTLTRAGARVGTPAYSSPESIRSGEHSPKTDQFSMSACLYEALCGKRAFPGDEAIRVAELIEKEPPPPIAQPLGFAPRVDEVLLRGMAIKPSERFESCREFGLALSEALLGIRERQPTLPDQRVLHRYDSAARRRATGTAILWLLVGATIATSIHRWTDTTPPPDVTIETSTPPPRPAFLSPLPVRKG